VARLRAATGQIETATRDVEAGALGLLPGEDGVDRVSGVGAPGGRRLSDTTLRLGGGLGRCLRARAICVEDERRAEQHDEDSDEQPARGFQATAELDGGHTIA
jgi:hypothetical protein